jgi:hypothetical protein
VVAYDGSSFYCKDSALAVPACGPAQFLTSDGTSLSCTGTTAPTSPAPQSLTVPTCPAGQVLTGAGGTLSCVPQTGGGDDEAGEWCGYRDYNCSAENANAKFGTLYEVKKGTNIACHGTPIRVYCRGVVVNNIGGDGGMYSEWDVERIDCPAGYYAVNLPGPAASCVRTSQPQTMRGTADLE